MPIALVHTIQPHVLTGSIVRIEVDISRGLHSFTIVGLAGKAVEESKDRIASAIKHSGYESPKSRNQKITISLSPAGLKKEGPLFDLPIAIAYLKATGEVSASDNVILIGELGLDGSVRPVPGILNSVIKAQEAGYSEVIVPIDNAKEAALVENITIFAATTLQEVIRHLDTSHKEHQRLRHTPVTIIGDTTSQSIRLEDIKGQEGAKRALTIAAAGRHNILFVGPPGTGKTLLARALQSILPPLNKNELLEVIAIHSLTGATPPLSSAPPFRSPHHTASHTALVGGGTHPKPGEITLAHRGVLFMDEFPEFERRSLDALRQPLEDRVISIARVQGSAQFPADFILVAALNPYRGSEDGTTDLARAMRETYKGKISGPILDRIDLWVEVPHVNYETLQAPSIDPNETTRVMTQIQNARKLQTLRFSGRNTSVNSAMSGRDIDECLTLNEGVRTLLKHSATRLNLSPRSYHRLLKVARTIADLEQSPELLECHVLEALQYRVQY